MSIRKHIPNTITSMNLLSGVVGVILALKGDIRVAFLLMLLAAVFDFFDGFAARLLGAYSEIGKELDSLADDVSFGVLPAVMMFAISGSDFAPLRYVPLLIAAFSALRLAKFNIDERQHSSFIGLPTPASAVVCGSLAYLVTARPDCLVASWCAGPVFIPALSLVLCWLLVSEIPMFAMKIATGDRTSKVQKIERFAFLAVAAVSAVCVGLSRSCWCVIPLATFAGYILINVIGSFFCRS